MHELKVDYGKLVAIKLELDTRSSESQKSGENSN